MRSTHFAMLTLVAAVTSGLAGCRQTTATTASGPLSPLAPNNAAVAPPSLVPFGGTTRVTPPPTGSYTVPNNYMGGSPVSAIAPNGFSSVAANTQPIGSGVQPAGWTTAGTVDSFSAAGQGNNVAPINGIAPNNAPVNNAPINYGPNPSSHLRAGGMHVNDLTGAPAPPGYRPQFTPQPSVGSNFQQNNPSNFQQRSNFAPSPVRTVPAPSTGNLAGGVTQGPSTEVAQNRDFPPATNNGASQQNLDWRRPGTQY